MEKKPYNNALDETRQIDVEERIASTIFQNLHVDIDEETASELSKDILYMVLQEFRKDLFFKLPSVF